MKRVLQVNSSSWVFFGSIDGINWIGWRTLVWDLPRIAVLSNFNPFDQILYQRSNRAVYVGELLFCKFLAYCGDDRFNR